MLASGDAPVIPRGVSSDGANAGTEIQSYCQRLQPEEFLSSFRDLSSGKTGHSVSKQKKISGLAGMKHSWSLLK